MSIPTLGKRLILLVILASLRSSPVAAQITLPPDYAAIEYYKYGDSGGFQTSGIGHMVFGAGGLFDNDLFLTDQSRNSSGRLVRLKDADHNGVIGPGEATVVVQAPTLGMRLPIGIAFGRNVGNAFGDDLFFADDWDGVNAVFKVSDNSGALVPSLFVSGFWTPVYPVFSLDGGALLQPDTSNFTAFGGATDGLIYRILPNGARNTWRGGLWDLGYAAMSPDGWLTISHGNIRIGGVIQGNGQLLALKDLNNDGDAADAGEMRTLYDRNSTFGRFTTFDYGPDGAIYATRPATAPPGSPTAAVSEIYRLADDNGDGDYWDAGANAFDSGEITLWARGFAGAPAAIEFGPAGDLYLSTFYSIGGVFSSVITRIYAAPPPNQDPVADAGADQTVSCNSACGATVTLDGSGSSDPDEDDLTYEWSGDFGVASGVAPSLTLGPGEHSIILTISDGRGGSDQDTVTIVVQDTTAPTFTTSVGPFSISITNLAGTAFTVPLPEAADNCVTVFVTSDAPALFAPGTTTVTFTATDAAGNTTTSSTTVTVTNASPVLAAIGPQTVNEGEGLAFTATAIDSDSPAQPLEFMLLDAPAGATIDAATGAFSWTPTEAQGSGTYAFAVSVSDGFGGTDTAFVTVTVQEVNAAPTLAGIDDQSIDEGTPLSIQASASDPDLPANALTFSLIGAPAGAAINPDTGLFSWTPTEAQGPGTFSFTLRVSDAGGLFDSKTLTVIVNEVNVAPVAQAASASVAEDGSLAITLQATDADGNALTFSVTTPPLHGTLSGTAPSLVYAPHADYHGADSLEFAVHDGLGGSAMATIVISVTPVNDPPATSDVSVTTPAGVPVAITLTGSDIDSAALTFEAAAATGGTVSGTSPTFTFVPAPGFVGQGGFAFILRDGDGGSASGVVTVTVTPPPPAAPSFDSIAQAIGALPGLNHGQRTSLLARLRNAQRARDRGHVDVAVRDLQQVAESLLRFSQTEEALDIVAMIQSLAASITAG